MEQVDLLRRDAELGDGLTAERLTAARSVLKVQVVAIKQGPWKQPRWPAQAEFWPGLLVLDGLLVRRVGLHGRYGGEVLGAGDLLRPWQQNDPAVTLPTRSDWAAAVPTRVVVLDRAFLERAAPYPEVTGRLFMRAMLRARSLASSMAIAQQPRVEERVLLMLWKLADRWGVVRPDGVYLRIRFTHKVLGELVAAQRPTVTGALASLQHSVAITCLPDRHWLLHPPAPRIDDGTGGPVSSAESERDNVRVARRVSNDVA